MLKFSRPITSHDRQKYSPKKHSKLTMLTNRRVQAQRKFAQGAYVPNSAERRADVTPTSHREATTGDDKRMPKLIINKGSARSLLDLVSMRNLHHHGQPIVLVERMLGAPLNGVDKPKSTEALVETSQPTVNGLKEQKGKECTVKSPKSPKKSKSPVKNCREVVLLRSRSSKRRIIKARTCVTNKINLNKRAHAPTRGDMPKKKCTRNKSPGFSDDDDMPLNKITLHNVDTKGIKAMGCENIRLRKNKKSLDGDNIPLNKMPKLVEGDNIPMSKLQKAVSDDNMRVGKIRKSVEGDNIPLNKVPKAVDGDNIPLSKMPKGVESNDTRLSKIRKSVEGVNTRLSKIAKAAEADNIPLSQIPKAVEGDNIPLSQMPKAVEGVNTRLSKIAKAAEVDNIPLSQVPKAVDGVNTRLSKVAKAAEVDNIPLSQMPKAMKGDNILLNQMSNAAEGVNTRLSKIAKVAEADNIPLSQMPKVAEGDNIPLSQMPKTTEPDNIPLSQMPKAVEGINTRLSKIAKAVEGNNVMLSQMPNAVESVNTRLSKIAKTVEGDNIPLSQTPKAVEGVNTRLSKIAKAAEIDNVPQSQMPKVAEADNIPLSQMTKAAEGITTRLSKIAKTVEGDNVPLSQMPKSVEGVNTRLSKIAKAVESDNIPLSQMPKSTEDNIPLSQMPHSMEDNIPLSQMPKLVEGVNTRLCKMTKAAESERMSKIAKAVEVDNIRSNTTRLSKMAKAAEDDNIPLSKMPNVMEEINIHQSNTSRIASKITKAMEGDSIPLSKIPNAVEDDNMRMSNARLSKICKTVEGDNIPLSKMSKELEKEESPLKKKAHVIKSSTDGTRELVKEDTNRVNYKNKPNGPLRDIVRDEKSDSKINVDKKPFCTLRSAANRSIAEHSPSSTEATEEPILRKEIKIDLQSSSLNLSIKLKDDSTDANNVVGATQKSICIESYYGRNRIERWIVDSTTTPPTLPAVSTPEVHHFKVPQLLAKRAKLKPLGPAPCPSEKFYAAKNVHTATESDIDSFCKKCITCRKLSMLVNLKGEKRATATSGAAPVAGVARSEPGDVYAFVDSEPAAPAPRPGGYNPKRLKTKHTKNMYLDLPQNSEHIVKLVEVKMPNQVKPIMSARLVPKAELDQDEASNKETVAPKKNGEKPSALATSSNSADKGSIKTKAESVDEHLEMGCDTKLLTSYAKAKEPNQEPATSCESDVKMADTVEAPTFHPTEAEFENPIAYLEKIAVEAASFGLCKVVPPATWLASCRLEAGVRFTATNQYVGRMYSRWGAAARELCAIKAHLATQQVLFTRPPLIDGIEVNLPKLYHIVQRMGGLKKVIEKEKWAQVAQELHYGTGDGGTGGAGGRGLLGKKLDQVYVKYLLPYDTLTNRERQNILAAVDREWERRHARMLRRARSPLRKQRQQLAEADAETDAANPAREDDSDSDSPAPDETDDCVLRGRPMSMLTFEKVAERVMAMYFPGAGSAGPGAAAAEATYWRLVESGDEHVCVNTAAVDTGARGLGFPRNKLEPGARHPWNLKVLSNSAGSVLRSLGAVLSLTVPTLHLGMLFSTSCWHRDPHGLPWLEYHHAGPPKIWYGVAAAQSECFRRAVEELCPAYCQNKAIWLPSDVVMIPPRLLAGRGVPLARLQQAPGEFVVVFPKAYSCSICTGYTISESVYYAPPSWLDTVQADFQMVRESFEPTVFSLEQLLLALVNDARAPPSALRVARHTLTSLVGAELHQRRALKHCGVTVTEVKHPAKKKAASWNVRELAECDICRTTLYLSKVSGLGDRRGAHCLQHALRLLRPTRPRLCDRPEDVTQGDVVLHCFYSEAALHHALYTLRRRLALSAQSR